MMMILMLFFKYVLKPSSPSEAKYLVTRSLEDVGQDDQVRSRAP